MFCCIDVADGITLLRGSACLRRYLRYRAIAASPGRARPGYEVPAPLLTAQRQGAARLEETGCQVHWRRTTQQCVVLGSRLSLAVVYLIDVAEVLAVLHPQWDE